MFKKEFWISSANKLKDVKYLALIALFIALKTMVGSLFIPVSENLGIYLTFLVVAIESAIIGPVGALLSGFITDLVHFMLFPTGPFFLGYTLSEMLGGLIFALFLYNQKITIAKLAIARFIINYFVNVGLGSLWSSILYEKAYLFYAGTSLIKNTIMLPIEVILLVLLFNLLIPFLKNKNLISSENTTPIPWK